MDWPNRFPYLVPIWHSLSNQNLYNKVFNSVDPNFDIEFGGIGTFNNIAFKNYRSLPYKINRPMLPFFIDDNNRTYSKYSGYNCLAFCPRKKVLFSSKYDQINVLDLELQRNRFSGIGDVDCENNHNFTLGQKTNVNPFSYNIANIWSQKVPSDYIIDLKLYENKNDLEVIVHSRRFFNILKYIDDSKEISRLQSKVSINSLSYCFPSSESLLDICDRNSEFSEEFLASFVHNSNIYFWNIEKNILKIENTTKSDVNDAKNRLINIQFLKDLNPFLYLYGTHKNVSLGDTRQNMSGSKNDSISLVDSDKFIYFKSFELFQSFVANPSECHQFIAVSDFNIIFFDLRYPNKNLFQCKHMLSDQIANKLVPVRYRSPTSTNELLLLLTSNHIKTCLFSFNCKLAIQPSSLHSPFYIESPHSINKFFPFESDRSFIRGMQILVNDFTNYGEDFFSIAVLLNNGDIFMQDFWSNHLNNDNDFLYENNVGNKIYFNREFDDATKNYMESINKYLDLLKAQKEVFSKHIKTGFCHFCFNDLIGSTMDGSQTNSDLDCLKSESHFCTCLRSLEEINEELKLLNVQSNDDPKDILSTKDSLIVDGNLKFRDNDKIDFEFIKQNWFRCENNPTVSIRQYCRPLTQRLFDQWCQEIDDEESQM